MVDRVRIHRLRALSLDSADRDGRRFLADIRGFALLSVFVAASVLGVSQVAAQESTEAPAVSGFHFATRPLQGETYQYDDRIVVGFAFDQPVTVTGNPQVALSIGSRIRQATYDAGSGSASVHFIYRVQTADVDTDGVSIAANAISLNGGSIKATADGTTDADLRHDAWPAHPGQKVDGSPAVSDFYFANPPASGDTYGVGEQIFVVVVFDQPVTVAGNPQLALSIGGRIRQATPAGGPEHPWHQNGATFAYTVQTADVDTDGVSIAANAISLNGGSIKASIDGTTDADLTHAAVSADANHKVDGSVPVPAVSYFYFFSAPLSGDTYERGERVSVGVVFDQPVTVTGNPQVALSIGSRIRQATLASGGSPNSRIFKYAVQTADVDTEGISIAANAISLNGTS